MSQYEIPQKTATAEVEVKRSKFLVEVRRITSSKQMRSFFLEKQKEHPKANHNCWGMIAGAPDYSNGYGFSDDGEPSGCAGKPIFSVMSHSGLGQIGLMVTRYFGGIKLGTGGMVKAYTESAKAGIEAVIREEFSPMQSLTLIFGYDQEPSVRYFLDNFDTGTLEFSYTENVFVTVSLKTSLIDIFKTGLQERFGISVVVQDNK